MELEKTTSKTIYLYVVLWVFNKNNNNWPLHCVSWINFYLQMATIYLKYVFQPLSSKVLNAVNRDKLIIFR